MREVEAKTMQEDREKSVIMNGCAILEVLRAAVGK